MAEGLRLLGYGPSVYTRIVRMGLIELGLEAAYEEVNPFAETPDPVLAKYSSFDRVPVLLHDGFTLTETSAILRYLDQLSPNPSLVPQDAIAAAQMAQVIGIVDFYGYVPMVREVFAHGYYHPLIGEPAEAARVQNGMAATQPVLKALDQIAQDGRVLAAQGFSLADIHLAPMLDYFTLFPEAAQAVETYPALNTWWQATRQRPSLRATFPVPQH